MSARVSRYLIGTGAAALAIGLGALPIIASTAAHAATTVELKEQQKNMAWSEFDHEGCDRDATSWSWHFVLPGGEATFVKLTVEFENAGEVVKTTDWAQDGKGAYIYLPSADTIVDGTAEINGTTPQGDFIVSHTCPGSSGGGGTTGTTGTTGTSGTTSTTGETTGTTSTTGETTGTTSTTGETTGTTGETTTGETTTGETTGTTGETTTGGGGGGATGAQTTGTTGFTGGGSGGVVNVPPQGGGGGGGAQLPRTGPFTGQFFGWALAAIVAGLGLIVAGTQAPRHARR